MREREEHHNTVSMQWVEMEKLINADREARDASEKEAEALEKEARDERVLEERKKTAKALEKEAAEEEKESMEMKTIEGVLAERDKETGYSTSVFSIDAWRERTKMIMHLLYPNSAKNKNVPV
jgi:hypothetical protein